MVTMTSIPVRRLLWAAAVLPMVGMIACAAGLVLLMPKDETEAIRAAALSKRPVLDNRAPSAPVGPLLDYAVIWQRNLRQPLVDAPPSGPAPVAALNIVLLGTAIEPGRAVGIFRDANGQTKWVQVGQTFGGARVAAIVEGAATLEFNGGTVTLTVAKGRASP